MTDEAPPGAPPERAPDAPLAPGESDTAPRAPGATPVASAPGAPVSLAPSSSEASAGAAPGGDSFDPHAERRELRRARIRVFQILLALGVFSAITGATISVSVAFALRPAVLALPGFVHGATVIAIARLWAWAVAPLAAWGAGRVLNARPWVIAFSICAWGEMVYLMFDMAIMGFGPGVYRSLGYFIGRMVTLGLGMLFAWVLAKRGRASADQLKARQEAEAEATRRRYAKWLEEQTSRR